MQLSYYERIGDENIKTLIHNFYLEIKEDSLLRPMYIEGFEIAEDRLYLFMVQYLGGPTTYNDKRGHPKLRQRHVVFPVNEQAKEHWLRNMKVALDKSETGDLEKEYLWNYFKQTAEFLKNR